jgi:hypothetical protein
MYGNKSRYSFEDQAVRSSNLGYKTKSVDQLFTQQKERKIHESMNPFGVKFREARDSVQNPNSFPIVFAMDQTGSMGRIPVQLLRDGLPHMIDGILKAGVADPQLLFIPVGDHMSDDYPLQVGQFESGDAELDMWLTRSYLEGNGGGNGGESYALPWYFAGYHTVLDSVEKRNTKGVLFTTGDEYCHRDYPNTVIKNLIGDAAFQSEKGSFSHQDLLAKAQESYHVFHLHVLEGSEGRSTQGFWKELLGENCILVDNSDNIPKIVADITKRIAGITIFEQPADQPTAIVQSEAPADNILL